MKVRFLLAISALLIISSVASGATISSCTEITAPGVYYLTQNLTWLDPGACIKINASDVIFDGQGYKITGGHMSGYGIQVVQHLVNGTNVNTNVTIRNVVLENWRGLYGYGIVFNGDYGAIENVKLLSAKITVNGKNNILRNITAYYVPTYGYAAIVLGSYNTIVDSYLNGHSLGVGGYCNVSNVTIDAAGANALSISGKRNLVQNSKFTGAGSHGIYISGSYNIIRNSNVSYNTQGIVFSTGTNPNSNIIENNTISYNSWRGVFVSGFNNTLRNNSIYGNGYNLDVDCYVDPITGKLDSCHHNIDATNLLDGKPVYYLVNVSNVIVPSDAATVYIINGTNISIRDAVLEGNYKGLSIIASKGVVVDNVTVKENYYGIILDNSSKVIITNSYISDSYSVGIQSNQKNSQTYTSSDVVIENSKFVNNGGYGSILIRRDSFFIIRNVEIIGGQKGLILSSATNIDIENSTICYTGSSGLYMDAFSSGVAVFNNTFCGNRYSGIYIGGSDGNLIANNTIHSIIGTQSYGIYVLGGSINNEIRNNTIYNASYGIYLSSSGSDDIVGNYIFNITYGVFLTNSDANVVEENVVYNASYAGIYLATGSDSNTITRNDVFNSSYGIYLENTRTNQIFTNTLDNIEYDIFLDVTQETYCDANITNNIGTGNEEIFFLNAQTVFANRTVSELILCNADRSVVRNIATVGSGIFAVLTDNSNFSNVTSLGTNGIYLLRSNSNSIINTSLINAKNAGIRLEYSNDNTIMNTGVINNLYGVEVVHSADNYIQVVAIGNEKGVYIPYSSTNNIVNSSEIYNNTYGVYVSSYSNTIANSKILNNTYAIYVSNRDNSIERNIIGNNYRGIHITAPYQTVTSNIIFNNTMSGVYIDRTYSNLVDNNTIVGNSIGITLYRAYSNTIANNTITNSDYTGIYLENSNRNLIYNNYFNNTDNYVIIVVGWGSYANSWNVTKQDGKSIVGGSYLGGNYWGKPDGNGFSDTCQDVNLDGICDDSYFLATDNIDYYPLTILQTAPPTDTTPPLVTVISPVNNSKLTTNVVEINVSAIDPSGIQSVVAEVDGSNTTLSLHNGYYVGTISLSDGGHVMRIYAKDNAGNVNSSVIVYFTTGIPSLKAYVNTTVVSLIKPVEITVEANDTNLAGVYIQLWDNNSIVSNGSVLAILVNESKISGFYKTSPFPGPWNSAYLLAVNTSTNEKTPVTVLINQSERRWMFVQAYLKNATLNWVPAVIAVNTSTLSIDYILYNVSGWKLHFGGGGFVKIVNLTMLTPEVINYVNTTAFNLSNLNFSFGIVSDGWYELIVFASDQTGNVNKSAIGVYVDNTKPSVQILTLQNLTYSTKSVTLDVSANEDVKWMYSIDGGYNVTFTPPINITLEEGRHTLVVYARDRGENVGKASVTFEINTPPELKVNFNTTLTGINKSIEIGIYAKDISLKQVSCSLWDSNSIVSDNMILSLTYNESGISGNYSLSPFPEPLKSVYVIARNNSTGYETPVTLFINQTGHYYFVNAYFKNETLNWTKANIIISISSTGNVTIDKIILKDLGLHTGGGLVKLRSLRVTQNGTIYINSTVFNLSNLEFVPKTLEDGKYKLVVGALDETGNYNSTVFTISVDNTKPVAKISAKTRVKVGEKIKFTSKSSDASGIARHIWNFGDGTTAEGKMVYHKYRSAGKYKVNLTVIDCAGNTNTTSVTVTVYRAVETTTITGVGGGAGGGYTITPTPVPIPTPTSTPEKISATPTPISTPKPTPPPTSSEIPTPKPEIGVEKIPTPTRAPTPTPEKRGIPGFELVTTSISLVAIYILTKRKRRK